MFVTMLLSKVYRVYWSVVLVSLQRRRLRGNDRMEVIGSKQRQEDRSFFKLHWEEETARRWEPLDEMN